MGPTFSELNLESGTTWKFCTRSTNTSLNPPRVSKLDMNHCDNLTKSTYHQETRPSNGYHEDKHAHLFGRNIPPGRPTANNIITKLKKAFHGDKHNFIDYDKKPLQYKPEANKKQSLSQRTIIYKQWIVIKIFEPQPPLRHDSLWVYVLWCLYDNLFHYY